MPIGRSFDFALGDGDADIFVESYCRNYRSLGQRCSTANTDAVPALPAAGLFLLGVTPLFLMLLVLKCFFLSSGPLPKPSCIPAQPLGIILIGRDLAPGLKLGCGDSENLRS